jgi:dipeptidyl aminopeptidase/acylaminoacyl peptidase
MWRAWWWAALLGAAALVACPAAGAARPFGVEDLLRAETFGAAAIDPSGRWAVFEQADPYATATRYDRNTRVSWSLTRLRLADLRSPGAVRPALDGDPRGVLLAGLSPGGSRLALWRLQDRAWRLGTAEVASGRWRTFEITPQEAGAGRSLQWLSEWELLVIARGDDWAPLTLRRGHVLAERLPAFWAVAARGQGAHTVLGSGAYLGVRRRAPESRLLWLDVGAGAMRVLARGAFTDLELSPDRRRVALLATGADLQPRGEAPVRGLAGIETEASELVVVDLATGAVTRPLPGLDVSPLLLSWSPGGTRLLVLARQPGALWSDARLRLLEVERGDVSAIGADHRLALDVNPVATWTDWMGETPLAFARAGSGGRADWFRLDAGASVNLTAQLPPPDRAARIADARRFSVLAAGRLWTVDRSGHVLRTSGLGLRPVALPERGGEGGRLIRTPLAALWLSQEEQGEASVASWTAAGVRVASVRVGEGTLLAARPDLSAFVARTREARGVEQLWLGGRDGAPVRLATINAHLADTAPYDLRPVRHADGLGGEVTSWLFLPRGLEHRAPLLVRPYLGAAFAAAPEDPLGELGLPLNMRVLTGRGYAVLVPSLPKPPGGFAEPAEGVAARILAAVDAAAADPDVGPRIDADRAALIGYSFGGYTVMAAITQTDRFHAAVSISGISDLTALWSGLSPFSQVEPEGGYTTNWRTGGVEAGQTRLGVPPWRDPGRYVRNSPLYAADRIETPLLLAHGAQDQIPLAQSEAMYSALFRQGKDALLVTYWGALHNINSPGDVRDLYQRMFAFVDRYLGPPLSPAASERSGSPAPASASAAPRPRRRSRPPGRCRPPSGSGTRGRAPARAGGGPGRPPRRGSHPAGRGRSAAGSAPSSGPGRR